MNSKTDSTKILLTISVGFTVIYLITGHNWAIITSLIIGLIGVFSSYLSDLIAALWMKIAWGVKLYCPQHYIKHLLFLNPLSRCNSIKSFPEERSPGFK